MAAIGRARILGTTCKWPQGLRTSLAGSRSRQPAGGALHPFFFQRSRHPARCGTRWRASLVGSCDAGDAAPCRAACSAGRSRVPLEEPSPLRYVDKPPIEHVLSSQPIAMCVQAHPVGGLHLCAYPNGSVGSVGIRCMPVCTHDARKPSLEHHQAERQLKHLRSAVDLRSVAEVDARTWNLILYGHAETPKSEECHQRVGGPLSGTERLLSPRSLLQGARHG